MEEILKEILAEIKLLNKKIDKLGDGNNLYDVCSSIDTVNSTLENIAKDIKKQ